MLSKREHQQLEFERTLYEELVKECTCIPLSDRPCAGLLAGGLCDNLHMDRGMNDYEDDEDYEPEYL